MKEETVDQTKLCVFVYLGALIIALTLPVLSNAILEANKQAAGILLIVAGLGHMICGVVGAIAIVSMIVQLVRFAIKKPKVIGKARSYLPWWLWSM